uniref:Uncharacterized protein n=1 Tax=Fervidicoccus fontis TaxID=683846 RepID=A0A7J3ZK32_9CREN
MSYLQELKDRIAPELASKGIKVLPKGSSVLRVVKDTEVVMTISDRGDYVELDYKGKSYKYDKWYTKPEHLAKVILGQF